MKNENNLFKNVALATVCITAATILAGCGQTSRIPNFEIPAGGLTSDPIEIHFYSTMGASLKSVCDMAIASFNEKYPNIKVTHDPLGGYDDVRDQIVTELSAGGGPDLAYCYPDHVALYNKASAVVTLDDLIAHPEYGISQETLNDFVPGYLNEGRQYGDGKMYTLPYSKSTEVLYYNKTFFEKNNLKVPETWEEMGQVCRQIKALDPASTPLGYDSESNWFITMCEQYGSAYTSAKAPHFLFDNETNRAFVKKMREWYKEGLITTQEIYGSYTSGLFTVVGEGNKSYMSIGSSAGATHQRPKKLDSGEYPFEVGIAGIPQMEKGKTTAISQGPSLCLFKNKDPQKTLAAWLFMRHLTTSVEVQAEFSKTSGYVPVLKSVRDIPAYADMLSKADGGDNVAFLSVKTCLENIDGQFTSPAFVGSSEARSQVGKLITKVLAAQITEDDDVVIDAAFKSAINACEESI